MAEKISGIVLNVRKYNDRNDIVTMFTRSRGRLAFISPSGVGKASISRRARLQPLSVVSTDLNFKQTAELQRLGSVSLIEVWSELYFHPVKRAETVFISEFLYRLLNAEMADERLWDFIVESLRLLDRMKRGMADFHIPFLVSLLPFSGIQPDVSGYSPGRIFSFKTGSFIEPSMNPGASISGIPAKSVIWVSRLNFYNISRLRLTADDRRLILASLLSYYSFHFPGISGMKSPEILHEIFS